MKKIPGMRWDYWFYFTIFPERIMNNHTYRIREFVCAAEAKLPKGSFVLDVGAGSVLQYQRFFADHTYIAQDICAFPGIQVVSPAEAIPLPSESVDAILCTQVLEHVEDPFAVFREFFRLLRPGGKVFLTTHFIFPMHNEPQDYWRFTRHGLHLLGARAGLSVRSIEPQGGVFILYAKLFHRCIPELIPDFPTVIFTYYLIASPIFFIINIFCWILDYLDRKKRLTMNYACMFEKPSRNLA